MKTPYSIFFFPNNMTACCDEDGQQIPEYQGRHAEAIDALAKAGIDWRSIKEVQGIPDLVEDGKGAADLVGSDPVDERTSRPTSARDIAGELRDVAMDFERYPSEHIATIQVVIHHLIELAESVSRIEEGKAPSLEAIKIPQMGHVKDGEVKAWAFDELYVAFCEGNLANPDQEFVTLAAYETQSRLLESYSTALDDYEREANVAYNKLRAQLESAVAERDELKEENEALHRECNLRVHPVIHANLEAELVVARARAKSDAEDLLIRIVLSDRDNDDMFSELMDAKLAVLDERAALTSLEGGQRPQNLV